MRRFTRLSLTLTVLAACLMLGADLWAKGGRGASRKGGGFKNGGGRAFKGGGFKGSDFKGNHVRGKAGNRAGNTGWKTPTTRSQERHHVANRVADDQRWSKRYAREQRKLDHRKEVASHLRDLSDRNGNERLKQVADDMEQRAQAHYDKQLEKLTQKDPLTSLDDTTTELDEAVSDMADGASLDDHRERSLDEVAHKLRGQENALYRQLRNEERKLAKRMETVERVRQLAEQTGDPDMLQAADRLEEWAMSHFDQRMAQITDFQQRHGLPDLADQISP